MQYDRVNRACHAPTMDCYIQCNIITMMPYFNRVIPWGVVSMGYDRVIPCGVVSMGYDRVILRGGVYAAHI